MTTDNTWFLWNHDDGRYGVAPAGVTPPDWHPAGPVEMLAQPPSGQSAAIIEAWMDPETLDVIHAERKAAWENEYGAGGVSKAAGYTVAMTRAQPAAATVSADAVLRDAIAHGVGGYIEIDGRQIHIPAEVLPGEQPSATAPADGVRAALTNLVREAQAVADDYHRPRYARLDDAIASARAALAAPAAPQDPAITLSGAQLLEALEYIAPDHATDPQQLESDATIQWGDGHAGKGYYCWHSDYPDEGSILLDGTTVITAALPPTIQDPLMVAAPQAGEDAREAKQRILDAAQWWADQRDVGPRPAKEAWTALAMRIDAELAMLTEGGAPQPATQGGDHEG